MKKAKLQQQVLQAINHYPAAANDDAILLEKVWLAQGWSDNRSLLDNLKSVSRPESISRRRRELHNLGLIEYSTERHREITEAYKSEVNDKSTYEAISWLND